MCFPLPSIYVRQCNISMCSYSYSMESSLLNSNSFTLSTLLRTGYSFDSLHPPYCVSSYSRDTCCRKINSLSSDNMPLRISRKISMYLGSVCRNTFINSIQFSGKNVRDHLSDSKQNFASADSAGPTGGNWKKSPLNINCIPPNGRFTPRMMRPISSNSSNIRTDIILISSIINVLT